MSLKDLLAKHNLNTNDNVAALHDAIRKNLPEVVTALLDDGVDINVKDTNNEQDTPLITALRSKHPEMAKLLIERGVDINLARGDGKTPLHMAAYEKQNEIAALLINKNVSGDKSFFLHDAIRNNMIDTVSILLDDGVDINKIDTNNEQDTPLITALRSKHPEMAKLLIERGADINLARGDGKTPLKTAAEEGLLEIVTILSKKREITFEIKNKKIDHANIGLEANFALARKKYQPYINLSNQVYSIDRLSSDELFKKYKELDLKSLYFRTDQIALDENLAKFLKKLTENGVREVFIFCDKEDSLNSDKFNQFIKHNQIRINLRVAPVSEVDLANIANDSIGARDNLGFERLKDYKITYKNGHEVKLLNNADTDRIILENYAEHKRQIAEKHRFVVQEPQYVTSNDIPGIERRVKNPTKNSLKIETEFQVNVDIDINLQSEVAINSEKEEENDLDLDLDQLERKFTRYEAWRESMNLAVKTFFEEAISQKLESYYSYYSITNRMFDSHPDIKYITEKALLLAIHNKNIIQHGIDINNMPTGLILKNGVIMASEQRPKSMPMNELTPILNPIAPNVIDNPLEYSWLQYASKSTILMDEFYGTSIAPKITGTEKMPRYLEELESSMDHPYSQKYLSYTRDKLYEKASFLYNIHPELLLGLPQFAQQRYRDLNFAHLSESDTSRIDDIYDNLEKRGIAVGFNKIIKDGNKDFLLEEKATLFLKKLFTEILPYPGDPEKLAFFKQITENCDFRSAYIEEVFEGLNGFYSKFQEFLLNQELEGEHRQKVIEKIKNIVAVQASDGSGFKILMGRLVNLLDYTASRGGSLYEQLEYLESKDALLIGDPKILNTAKQLELNVIHKSAKLGEKYDDYARAIRQLSVIPPYARPSLDSYDQYRVLGVGNVDYILGLELPNSTERQFLEDASGNKHKLQQALDNYNASPGRKYESTWCIVTKNTNLLDNFTIKQAKNNLRLLELNMRLSSGKYYEATYPTQEFESYVSLFGTLFSKIKIDYDVKTADRKYNAGEDYNKKILTVNENIIPTDKSEEVKTKELQHEKMIDNFVEINSGHPEFNFAQVVALGLVANLNPEVANDIINKAKTLTQYNEYLSQFLRITLSTSITEGTDLSELNARTEAITRNIKYLFREYNGKLIHEIITNDSKNPENLAIFASCFAKDQNITYEKTMVLLEQINALDNELKQRLLRSLAHTRIPFDQGKIVNNNFPHFSIETLSNHIAIQDVIEEASNSNINYRQEARFNDVSMDTRENAPIDLNSVQKKYQIDLPKELENKNYKEIKNYLTTNRGAISKILSNSKDQKLINEFSRDLLKTLFSGVAHREMGYERITEKTINLLFDDSKILEDQFYEIEHKKHILEKLFKKSPNLGEKEILLNALLSDPQLAKSKLGEILIYLNDIDYEKLQKKGYSISKLVNDAGNRLINEHFDVFKISVDFFVQPDSTSNFKQMRDSVLALSDAKYSKLHIKTLIKYALNNNDYQAIEILRQLKGDAPNIDKIVSFLTSITPKELREIDKNIGIKNLVNLQNVDKISTIAKIVLEFNDSINPEQYKTLLQQAKSNDLNHIKLIKAYLFFPETENLTKNQKIQLVFDNFASLEKIPATITQINAKRFDHSPERVKDKISKIIRLNTDDLSSVPSQQQEVMYNDFAAILDQAKKYEFLDLKAIKKEAIKLKRERSLLKDSSVEEIKAHDLKFVALACSSMYYATGMFPRDTQLLSIINSITQQGHIIEEIATGQGKGLITAMHAAYLSYTGQTVDVATSDPKLSKRDLEEFTPFYENLSIKTASHIITAASDVSEYKRGGVNYGIASDLALARANREFYKATSQIALNADVSLICDEVDFTITSDVNYKLAASLVSTTQEETRVLLKNILEFSKTSAFQNGNLSRKDDIHNLELFLNYQFQKYDSSYKLPLTPIQIDALHKNTSPQAQELYFLHKALLKTNKFKEEIFDKLLDSVTMAKTLKIDEDFVILQENLDNKNTLLQITPVIKNQPSRKTMFGDGVQAFVNLLMEEQNPELKGRFDISLPASTIFNINPKSFLDYYRMTGGRIIGLTGTAGNPEELEEFRQNNKMLAYAIPSYQDDKKIIQSKGVENKLQQNKEMMEILNDTDQDKPVIIFCSTPQEAQLVYEKMNGYRPDVQISIPSDKLEDIKNAVDNAGKKGKITITTPMLGRGHDFSTKYPGGFLGINLCTDITLNDLRQIEGRIGRNGQEGEFVSLFNKELYSSNITEHMLDIARDQKDKRLKLQPPGDILQFLGSENQDNQLNAIRTNELVYKIWNQLLKENAQKSYAELRIDLVMKLEEHYPHQIAKLNKYLAELDKHIPEKTGAERTANHYIADYSTQDNKDVYITSENYQSIFKGNIDRIARAIAIDRIEVPNLKSPIGYKIFYNAVFQAHEAIMYTHAFAIDNNLFNIHYKFNDKILKTDSVQKIVYEIDWQGNIVRDLTKYTHKSIFLKNKKLYYQILNKPPLELTVGYSLETGIPEALYNKFLNSQNDAISLTNEEKESLEKFLISKKYIGDKLIAGEGSIGTLMVNEFKNSFTNYNNLVKSEEVSKISNIIDNLGTIENIDTEKLEQGKYQAIQISTLFTDSASHAESILTDGKLLFWVNRGGGAENPGIRVFQITKDIELVKFILDSLKESKSQADTREIIYTLLREEGDQNLPSHIQIDMPAQTIGNCGWTQVESLLKAAAIVGRIGEVDDLPDPKSQKWQKALKDSEDIYQDWFNFDQVQRLEAMLYTMDENFIPQVLNEKEQEKINNRRAILENPISHELIKNTLISLNRDIARFDETIYQEYVHKISNIMALEVAVGSSIGEALQRIYGKEATKKLLTQYQEKHGSTFDKLEDLHTNAIKYSLESVPMQDQLLKQVLLAANDHPEIDLKTLSKDLKSSLHSLNHNVAIKDPIINALSYAVKQHNTLLINILSSVVENNHFSTSDIKLASSVAKKYGSDIATKALKISYDVAQEKRAAQAKLDVSPLRELKEEERTYNPYTPKKLAAEQRAAQAKIDVPAREPETYNPYINDKTDAEEKPDAKKEQKSSVNDNWELKRLYYSSDINKLNEVFEKYGIKDVSADMLQDKKVYRKLALKLHPDKGGNENDFRFMEELRDKLGKDFDPNVIVAEVKTTINQVNTVFKAADTVVDIARLAHDPTIKNAQKAALSAAHLGSMYYGVNEYSIVTSVHNIAEQILQGNYTEAASSALTSLAYMAAPTIIENLGVPYLDVAYSAALTFYTGHSAVRNAYSLYQEVTDVEPSAVDLFKQAINNNDLQEIMRLTGEHQELKEQFIDNNGKTLLSYAVHKDRPEIAAFLIQTGFQPQRTWTDVINQMSDIRIEKTEDEIARSIGGATLEEYNKLQNFENEENKITTPKTVIDSASQEQYDIELRKAAKDGDLDEIEELLELGANIDAQNKYNDTALHLALMHKQYDAVAKLLELGASINVQNKEGYTAIDFIAKGDIDAIVSAVTNNFSSKVITNIIDQAEDKDAWKFVEAMINKIDPAKRVNIITDVLKDIDNPSKKENLLKVLSENEKNMVNALLSINLKDSVDKSSEKTKPFVLCALPPNDTRSR